MRAPEWLRQRARWLLRDEIRAVQADLAIARADALDAVLALNPTVPISSERIAEIRTRLDIAAMQTDQQ